MSEKIPMHHIRAVRARNGCQLSVPEQRLQTVICPFDIDKIKHLAFKSVNVRHNRHVYKFCRPVISVFAADI
jgi:hypothetical protein